jgi:hypothetical protein
VHGNTALQVGGGLVGMLIIEDAADEVPADLQARGLSRLSTRFIRLNLLLLLLLDLLLRLLFVLLLLLLLLLLNLLKLLLLLLLLLILINCLGYVFVSEKAQVEL